MKTIIIIVYLMLFFISPVRYIPPVKQFRNPHYESLSSFHGDTAQYLVTNFFDEQQLYKGRKLKYFLEKLELPIARYSPFLANESVNGVRMCAGLALTFNFTAVLKYPEAIRLFVYFKSNLPMDSCDKPFRNDYIHHRQTTFTGDNKRFYENEMIDSIKYHLTLN